jgi:flavin reductase
MIDKTVFRSAMAQLGAAVNIITTDGPAGRHGMTASAVCSVTDDPASLLVCINQGSRMNSAIRENGVLGVNVLGGEHEALSGVFATRGLDVEERFARAEWRAMANGVPGLVGALVSLSCRVHAVQDVGTHGVFICHVEELDMRTEGEGLVYFGRAFHRLPLMAA